MIIIAISILLVVAGGLLLEYKPHRELLIITILTVGLTGTALSILFLPIFRYTAYGEIQKFESVRTTIEMARANGAEIETAALQVKIAEMNAWLASQQFYNGTVFDIYIPDAVMDLKPIE